MLFFLFLSLSLSFYFPFLFLVLFYSLSVFFFSSFFSFSQREKLGFWQSCSRSPKCSIKKIYLYPVHHVAVRYSHFRRRCTALSIEHRAHPTFSPGAKAGSKRFPSVLGPCLILFRSVHSSLHFPSWRRPFLNNIVSSFGFQWREMWYLSVACPALSFLHHYISNPGQRSHDCFSLPLFPFLSSFFSYPIRSPSSLYILSINYQRFIQIQ